MESQKEHEANKKRKALFMAQPGYNQHLNDNGDLVEELSIREFLVGKWVVKRFKDNVDKIKAHKIKIQKEIDE